MIDAMGEADITSEYRWICNKRTQTKVAKFLRDRQTAAGDAAILGRVGELTPLSIEFLSVPKFPADVILLANPADLYIVYPDLIRYRKVDNDTETASRDVRKYFWYYYLDFVIKNPKKMVLGINVDDVINPYSAASTMSVNNTKHRKKKVVDEIDEGILDE